MCIFPYLAYKSPDLSRIQLPCVSSTMLTTPVLDSPQEEILVLTAVHQGSGRRQVLKEAVVHCKPVCGKGHLEMAEDWGVNGAEAGEAAGRAWEYCMQGAISLPWGKGTWPGAAEWQSGRCGCSCRGLAP